MQINSNSHENKILKLIDSISKPLQSEQHRHIAFKNQQIQDEKKLKESLTKLQEELNKEMRRINTDITFKYDDALKGLIVTVKDGQDGKVIREIPSAEAIELMKKMRDVIGNIFDKKA